MKKKKLTKEQELKQKLASALDDLAYQKRDASEYRAILNSLVEIFSPERGTYNSREVTFARLPQRVAELFFQVKSQEGAYHPFRETIENQREIIRWLIKPSTAEKPKEEVL
mgnify:CR=1 FL=1